MGKITKIFSLIVALLMAGVISSVEALEYGDIILDKNSHSMKKADVKAVLFPHWFHRIRYKCKVCHEEIFIMKKGANEITMRKIMDGKACGTCHNGLIAWEPLYCDKCHSVTDTSVNQVKNNTAVNKAKNDAAVTKVKQVK